MDLDEALAAEARHRRLMRVVYALGAVCFFVVPVLWWWLGNDHGYWDAVSKGLALVLALAAAGMGFVWWRAWRLKREVTEP